MKYLDYIERCNRHDLRDYLPLRYADRYIGHLRKNTVGFLQEWPELFDVTTAGVRLIATGDSVDDRSREWNRVITALADRGVLPGLLEETYPVTSSSREHALFAIDRAAAPFFGVRAFGQHLNGFVRKADGIHLWVGKRSSDRRNFPGKLDHLVAGGLPYRMSLRENLVKECMEEAGIPREIALQALSVGALTYVAESERGLKPDTLYCYDLELPEDFTPQCTDGEVEYFELWSLERVMETLLEGEKFKLNCNLVIIDFLIRHGRIGPEEEQFLELVSGLHAPLP